MKKLKYSDIISYSSFHLNPNCIQCFKKNCFSAPFHLGVFPLAKMGFYAIQVQDYLSILGFHQLRPRPYLVQPIPKIKKIYTIELWNAYR